MTFTRAHCMRQKSYTSMLCTFDDILGVSYGDISINRHHFVGRNQCTMNADTPVIPFHHLPRRTYWIEDPKKPSQMMFRRIFKPSNSVSRSHMLCGSVAKSVLYFLAAFLSHTMHTVVKNGKELTCKQGEPLRTSRLHGTIVSVLDAGKRVCRRSRWSAEHGADFSPRGGTRGTVRNSKY